MHNAQDPMVKSSQYSGMVIDLVGIAFTLFVPKYLISEQNWRLVYLGLLVAGWVFVFDYVRRIRKNLQQHYEKSLFWTLLLLSVLIAGFLTKGTITFFTQPSLLKITGECRVSSHIEEGVDRYQLEIKNNSDREIFEVDKEIFNEHLAQGQQVQFSEKFVHYPCRQSHATATFVPHFGFLVKNQYE